MKSSKEFLPDGDVGRTRTLGRQRQRTRTDERRRRCFTISRKSQSERPSPRRRERTTDRVHHFTRGRGRRAHALRAATADGAREGRVGRADREGGHVAVSSRSLAALGFISSALFLPSFSLPLLRRLLPPPSIPNWGPYLRLFCTLLMGGYWFGALDQV